MNNESNIPNVLAILKVSGITPSEFCTELLHKIEAKEITYKQAGEIIKERVMKRRESEHC